MPDVSSTLNSITSAVPDLGSAFMRGVQLTAALFILVGIVYFLRRFL